MGEWIEWNDRFYPLQGGVRVRVRNKSGSTYECSAGEVDWSVVSEYMVLKNETPTPDHYSPTTITDKMVGQPLDPALIAQHYKLTPMLFTVLKKTLRCGRSIKDKKTDIAEIKGALDRELQLMELGDQ